MIQDILRTLQSLFTWLIVVAPWEQALRVRMGKHVRLLKAGAYLRIPFIDRIYRQSIRRRLCTIQPQTLTTHDGKAITLGCMVGYQVGDLRLLYNTLHDSVETIEASVASLVATFIVNHSIEECTPQAVEQSVRSQLKLEIFGLTNSEFYITNFAVVRTYRLISDGMNAWRLNPTPLSTVDRDRDHDEI